MIILVCLLPIVFHGLKGSVTLLVITRTENDRITTENDRIVCTQFESTVTISTVN